MPVPSSDAPAGQPEVTVIIPVFNDWHALQSCFQALQKQTLPASRFEILIVDNASTQPNPLTLPVNARLLHEPVSGSYNARNQGLRYASGSVIAFTDADCLPAPDWLEMALATLAADASIQMIGGRIEVFPASLTNPTPMELYECTYAFPQADYVNGCKFSVTANLILRRDVLSRTSNFNSALQSGGDYEFCRRAVESGCKLVYRDDVLIRHPARKSFFQYFCKERRVRAGQVAVARLSGKPFPFSGSFICLFVRPPLRKMLNAWSSKALPRWDKLKLMYAIFVANYITLYFLVGNRVRWSLYSRRTA